MTVGVLPVISGKKVSSYFWNLKNGHFNLYASLALCFYSCIVFESSAQNKVRNYCVVKLLPTRMCKLMHYALWNQLLYMLEREQPRIFSETISNLSCSMMPNEVVSQWVKNTADSSQSGVYFVCPLCDFKCAMKVRQKNVSTIVCLLLPARPFLSTSCAQKAAGLWINHAEINREAGRENYFPLLLEHRLAFHIFIWSFAVGFQWLAALAGDTASDSWGWMAHFSRSNFCWEECTVHYTSEERPLWTWVAIRRTRYSGRVPVHLGIKG